MVIMKIQESCTYLLIINRLFNYYIKISYFQKTFNAWFTDQNSKPLKIEDKIDIPLVIK